MNVGELLKRVRGRLRDTVGRDADKLWQDFDLVDDAMNEARQELFRIAPDLIVDSSTASDLEGRALCTIPLTAGVGSYECSPKINRITRVQLASQTVPLAQATQAELPSNWRDLDPGDPYCYCLDLDTDRIQFVPAPKVADAAALTVRRFPLSPLSSSNLAADLGFRDEYHKDLIPKILAIALMTEDGEVRRPQEAAMYEERFKARAEEISLEVTQRLIGQHTITPQRAFRTK